MIKNTFNIIKFFIFSLIVIPAMSFSAPLFDPGETLDPGCLPSDPDCTVSTSSASLLYPSFTYASSTFTTFEYASSTFAIIASSSQWTTNGSNIFYNTGSVGIGTSTPSSALTVIGTSTTDRLEITDGIYYVDGASLAFGSTTIGSYYFANAGNSSSTGGANIAMGPGALYLNTSGGGNMAFGSSSLYSNINGGGNIAFGTDALFSNISGGGNIAFGPQSLYSNISGGGNMAFGSAALANNISGGGNYAFGQGALTSNTTGSGNLAFGNGALYNNTEGHANAAFGNQALQNNATSSANTAFGYSSLQNLTEGYTNTAIGYNSGSNLVTGTDNIFIGSNTSAPSTNLSNFLNIGNIIYGDRSSGNVGIGTSTPVAALSVVSATGSIYSFSVSGGNATTATGSAITMLTGAGGTSGLAGTPGGDFSFITGVGGSALGPTFGHGANGGNILFTTANGGNGYDMGGRGGPGGNMSIVLGDGGQGFNGGAGGSFSIIAGDSGGGNGYTAGTISLTGGRGGTSGAAPTNGGDIYLTSGDSGNASTRAGNIILSPDSSTNLGSAGEVRITTLGEGQVFSTASGTLYSESFTSNDELLYKYNTNPLLYWANESPKVLKTISVTNAANYGAWDGEFFWTSNHGDNSISKLNQNGEIVATYNLGAGINPLQLVYDGRYVWVASADVYGHLVKFDTVTETVILDVQENPSGLGLGGIQGVVWDGTNIWIGVSQSGGGSGSGFVAKISTTTGTILASTTGQTNVNGLAITDIRESTGLVRYIWAANANFMSKIKASDMSYNTIGTDPETYRIATDGKYIYGASFSSHRIKKYSVYDGSLKDAWPSGTQLNTVAFDGKYIWTAGDDLAINIHDRDTGNIVYTLDNAGQSDLVFDGSYMWSVIASTNQVKKISLGNAMGNLKVAERISVMDENSNTSILFSGTSTGSSFMMSKFGIGTSTPSTALTVIGTSTLQDIIPGGPYDGNMSAYSIGASTTRWASVWAEYINIGTSTWSLSQTDSRFGIFNSPNGTGTEVFTILSNGNIGIGTTTPESALSVIGNISATGSLSVLKNLSIGEKRFSYDSYDQNVLAAYHFDNNLNDSSSNDYDGVQIGTPAFGNSTPLTYEGTYWMSGGSGNNMRLPATLISRLSESSAWTLEFWIYKDDNDTNQDNLIGNLSASNYPFTLTMYSGNSGCGPDVLDFWVGSGQYCTSYSGYYSKWTRINIEWTGTRQRLYLDGVQKMDVAQATNLISSSSVINIPDSDSTGSAVKYDKFIVSDIARGGLEQTIENFNSPRIFSDYSGNLFVQNASGTVNSLTTSWIKNGSVVSYSGGNVGIGTSTPTANLTASGTIRFTSLGSAGGNLVTDTDGNITVSSDERLKDIQSNYEKGLADIQKIVPINYKWKPETGYETTNVYTGFSAQNMSIAIPEAVATSSSGYLTLADRPILAALVNAVKDIGSFINKIENGIAYLKNVVVDRFTVGSNISPEGITMYDKTTKQPYCVVINNGVLSNEPGECISSNLENTATVEMPEIIMGDLIIEDSTILDGEATTTNEIVEGTSTTTDPILDETVEGTSTTTNEEEIISTSTEEIIIEEPITEETVLDSGEQATTTPIE